MAQTFTDAKGIYMVVNDQGQVVFSRPQTTASGNLSSPGVTAALQGWHQGAQGAANALDLYATIASGTGAATTPAGSSTATTGPPGAS